VSVLCLASCDRVFASIGPQGHRVVGLHRASLGAAADGRGTTNLARRVMALKARLAVTGS
jgi:hypothetical protein